MINVVVDFDGILVLDGKFLVVDVAVVLNEDDAVAFNLILKGLLAGLEVIGSVFLHVPFVAGAVGKELIVVGVVAVVVVPGANEGVGGLLAGSLGGSGGAAESSGEANEGQSDDKYTGFHCFVIVLMFNE